MRTSIASIVYALVGRPLALESAKTHDLAVMLTRRVGHGVRLTREDALRLIESSGSQVRVAVEGEEPEVGENGALVTISDGAGESEEDEGPGYTIEQGVAVIPIEGMLIKRPARGLLASLAPVSTDELQATIEAALEDGNVRSILLDIDSPGGTVDGTMALGDWLREQRGRKPIGAYCNGMAASGGYFIACAADPGRVWAHPSASIGSIGVLIIVPDTSKAFAREGIGFHVYSSGEKKAAMMENVPPTDVQQAHVSEQVGLLAELFYDHVARCRGTTREAIAALGGGAYVACAPAVDMLIDGFGRREQAIEEMARALVTETNGDAHDDEDGEAHDDDRD